MIAIAKYLPIFIYSPIYAELIDKVWGSIDQLDKTYYSRTGIAMYVVYCGRYPPIHPSI